MTTKVDVLNPTSPIKEYVFYIESTPLSDQSSF